MGPHPEKQEERENLEKGLVSSMVRNFHSLGSFTVLEFVLSMSIRCHVPFHEMAKAGSKWLKICLLGYNFKMV